MIARRCLEAQEREEKELVVILLCSMFEVMLEAFLHLLMIRLRIPKGTREFILRKKFSGVIARLEDLFPGLVGQSFKGITTGTEFKDFYDQWDKIRTERNEFLHNEHGRISRAMAQDAANLIEPCFRLFKWLNNTITVEARYREV